MSENKEDVDMQVVLATRIIKNGGCEGKWCTDFKGTECPLFASYRGCTTDESIVRGAKAWLKKYHQQKAEAAEVEEHEVKKTCGKCQYIRDADGHVDMVGSSGIMFCHKKNTRVPVELPGCRNFEPMATGRMTLQSQHSISECAECAAYTERISKLEKEKYDLSEKCERLTEQLNELANDRNELRKIVSRLDNEIVTRYVECKNEAQQALQENRCLRSENAELRSSVNSMKAEKLTLDRAIAAKECLEKYHQQRKAEEHRKYLCEMYGGLRHDDWI